MNESDVVATVTFGGKSGRYAQAIADEERAAVLARVLKVLEPFAEFVHVPKLGGTPADAVRKEFGLCA